MREEWGGGRGMEVVESGKERRGRWMNEVMNGGRWLREGREVGREVDE